MKDLEALIDVEKERGVPTEEPVAQLERKTLKQLGAPIDQFDKLQASSKADDEDFQRSVVAEQRRRVEDRMVDTFADGQAATAPPINDSLTGARIEVLRWVTPDEGARFLFWFPGVVKRVSDGTVPKGPRAKKTWPEGCALVEFEAQPMRGDDGPTEEWVHLRHNKWNGNANGCWRLDLDYESAADD